MNEQWCPNLRGVWGGEIRQETVTCPQSYNSNKKWRGELVRMFGNVEWRPHARVLLQGGAMLEHHYFTGIGLSPHVAANITVMSGHVIRAGISRAYHSPTFFEEEGNQVFVLQSGAVADVVTVPSDGLAPERALSRETAYAGSWRPVRLEMDVRLFKDKINDFIGQDKFDFDPSDNSGIRPNEFRYANIGSAKSHGGEIHLRWRPVYALDLRAARRWKWQGHDIEAAVVGQSLLGDYQAFRDTNIFRRRTYGSLSLGW